VRRLLAEDPEARIVSISQNDWAGYCTCPACRALDEAEGTPAAVTAAEAVRRIPAAAAVTERQDP